MKKISIFLVFILLSAYQVSAQNAEQVIRNISAVENTKHIKIQRFMLSMIKVVGGLRNVPLIKNIHSMEVFTLEDHASFEHKSYVKEQVHSLKDGSGYETLLQVKDAGSFVRIMIKKEKNIIKEVILFCSDEKDATILRMTGKIKEADLAEFAKKYR
jgi:hypothetical protein